MIKKYKFHTCVFTFEYTFFLFKKYSWYKRIIVEKSFLEKISEFMKIKNIYKNKNKEIYKNKITSFENLYFKMETEQKFLNQNVNFHEKIFLEKLKIIKKIKKLK